MKSILLLLSGLCISYWASAADDSLEVEATRIKVSKELPKVLYVVPWKDMEKTNNNEQKLVLHDFFGDLYEPVLPQDSPDPQPPQQP